LLADATGCTIDKEEVMQLPPTSLVHLANDAPEVPRVYDTPPLIVTRARAPRLRASVARLLRRPSAVEHARSGCASAANQPVSR
jgi:hypothetical protein